MYIPEQHIWSMVLTSLCARFVVQAPSSHSLPRMPELGSCTVALNVCLFTLQGWLKAFQARVVRHINSVHLPSTSNADDSIAITQNKQTNPHTNENHCLTQSRLLQSPEYLNVQYIYRGVLSLLPLSLPKPGLPGVPTALP